MDVTKTMRRPTDPQAKFLYKPLLIFFMLEYQFEEIMTIILLILLFKYGFIDIMLKQ